MKIKALPILFALTILMVAANAYADENKGKKEKKSSPASIIHKVEAAFESELQFEGWMLEIDEFAGTEVITEETIDFESWMLQKFDIKSDKNIQNNQLCFESWMMTPFISDLSGSFNEPELKFESWMMKRF